MEPSKTVIERMEEARQLEKQGQLPAAAAIYQKLFNSDLNSEQVTGRLLVIYRKLKDYKKELSVLNEAIAAFELRQKTARQNWITAHPAAAKAGRSILRQLEKEGNVDMALGADPLVERWMRRKDLVTGRISGKKVSRPKDPGNAEKGALRKRVKASQPRHIRGEGSHQERKQAEVAAKKAAKERRERLAKEKREEREQRASQAFRKMEEREQRKADAARRKAGLESKKAERERSHSLFIVMLRYLVSIEEIDAAMKQHMSYLRKHFKNRDFLASGRMVPRTGGIILARAKNRKALEKTVKQDPFVKRKLASAAIIEFTASQLSKELEARINLR